MILCLVEILKNQERDIFPQNDGFVLSPGTPELRPRCVVRTPVCLDIRK